MSSYAKYDFCMARCARPEKIETAASHKVGCACASQNVTSPLSLLVFHLLLLTTSSRTIQENHTKMTCFVSHNQPLYDALLKKLNATKNEITACKKEQDFFRIHPDAEKYVDCVVSYDRTIRWRQEEADSLSRDLSLIADCNSFLYKTHNDRLVDFIPQGISPTSWNVIEDILPTSSQPTILRRSCRLAAKFIPRRSARIAAKNIV